MGGDDRFWQRVDRAGGPYACWPWRGKIVSGYGRVLVAGRSVRAHRHAWMLERGEIAAGLGVLHRCDTKACCNPRHLYVGTQKENVADSIARGKAKPPPKPTYGSQLRGERHWSRRLPNRLPRGARNGANTKPERRPTGDRNGMRLHPESVCRGETNVNAKLSDDAVRLIRSRHRGGSTQIALAREFGIAKSLVSRIVRGVAWRHVN